MDELTLLEKVFLKFRRPMSSPFVSVFRKRKAIHKGVATFSCTNNQEVIEFGGFTTGLCPFKVPHCDHSDVQPWASRLLFARL